jgi:dCTP deaminase
MFELYLLLIVVIAGLVKIWCFCTANSEFFMECIRKMLVGAVLSDSDITNELGKRVVIEPFNLMQLKNSSYDVRLGEHYYQFSHESHGSYLNPWNQEHISKFWALNTAKTVTCENQAKMLGVSVGDQVILVKPGETILAHTQEFIGGRGQITTMMKTRSGIGRSCLCVCKAAGWGDVSFCSRWTMEICNSGPKCVVLIVGERVAQIVFLRTGIVNHSYEQTGSYQKANPYDMESVKREWTPEMMLPKLKRDTQ